MCDMPEWPDLHVLRQRLANALTGRAVTAAQVYNFRYRDEKHMGKVYLLRGEDPAKAVPGLAELGPEADPETFDEAEFIRRGRKRQYEVRNLLLDQSFLAGIGNAYADEILFAACPGCQPAPPGQLH